MKSSSIIISILFAMAVLLLFYLDVPSALITSHQTIDATAQRNLVGSLEATSKQLKLLTERFSESQQTLQRRMDALETTVRNLPKAGAGLNPSENVRADPEEWAQESLSHEERLVREAEEEYRQGAAKSSQLENEDIDYTWSSAAEDQIIRNFEADRKFDLQGFDVICRATHCTVRGEFGDSKTRQEKISWLMTLIPWDTTSFYHGDDMEGTTGALYVMRSQAP